MRIPTFAGRFEATYGDFKPETLEEKAPEFKERYLDKIGEVVKPYQRFIDALPHDVVVRYEPNARWGSESLDVISGKTQMSGETRSWPVPLQFTRDSQKLDAALEDFKAWFPGALLRILVHLRGFESSERDSVVRRADSRVQQVQAAADELTEIVTRPQD